MERLEQQEYRVLMVNEKLDVEQVCENANWSKAAESLADVEMIEPIIGTAEDCAMEARESFVDKAIEDKELEKKKKLALACYDPAHAQPRNEQLCSNYSTLSMQPRRCESNYDASQMLQSNLYLESRPYNATELYSRETGQRFYQSLDSQTSGKMTTAQETSQVVSGPYLITSLGSFGTNACRWQENDSDCFLFSNKNFYDGVLRISSSENWKDYGDGETGRCTSSSCLSDAKVSADSLSGMPKTLNVDLSKTFECKGHSVKFEIDDCISKSGDDNIKYVANQASPRVANFEKTTIANGASKLTSISDYRSRYNYTSDEYGATSEAEEMVRSLKTLSQCKNSAYGALDLLVNAIQATSDSPIVGKGMKVRKDGRKETHDSQLWSVETHFVYGKSPIVKKKVLRRAKSAFKNPTSEAPLREIQVPLSVRGRSSHKRRIGPTSEQKLQQGLKSNRMDVSPLFETEILKDEGPLVRSKRGRSQALPVRFYDSVLQPWKRKTRAKTNQNML